MEYCLLILRWFFQVDWMHLDNRSILTAGNFKITRDGRIDTDHKEDTAAGIRSD